MPILHFRITKAVETINISRPLHSQDFTFRRAVVVKHDNTDITNNFKGGVTVQCSFLQGDEFVSNINTNQVLVPFEFANTVNDVRFEFPLASEDIRSSFNVEVYNYDRSHAVEFMPTTGTPPAGAIEYIDMYFSFTSLQQSSNLYA